MPSPDLMARWVIVAAYCYYVLDAPVMDDADYDRFSREVADNWDALTNDRKWALGSPEAIRVSGHHIRFSFASVAAARAMYRDKYGKVAPSPTKWLKDKKIGRFVTAADFA